MSEDVVTLEGLLDLSIGTPQGTVNFTALHALLHALLRQLGIRELETRWRDSLSGHTAVGVPGSAEVGPLQVEGDVEPEARPGSELQERAASASDPGSSPGTAAAEDEKLRSRIQSCEDGVSEAMRLIQQLHEQKDVLVDELHQQQKMFVETVSAVETCCHSVDVLEESVKSLRDTFHKCPEPEELRGCVTWDVMQSVLLSDRENLQKELENGGVVDEAVEPAHKLLNISLTSDRSTTSSPRSVSDTVSKAAPRSPAISGDIFREESSTRTIAESSSVPSAPPLQNQTASWKSRNLELYSDTVEALRNAVRLKDKFNWLEARVAALEEGKVDHTQLTPLRDAITNKGFQDVSKNLMDQLKQQTALISSLMSDQEKSEELVNDVKTAMLHLQTECENLQETTRSLQEDGRQMQRHIEKADRCALDNKVSRLQFDSVTEQLNTMFHELLLKVTGQEQDWHKVVDKLSTEMEHKLNRIELDSVKKQLEDRWRNIHEKLQTQGAPEHEDAAGIRKRLVDRFHCLSCDRPVVKHTPGPYLVTLPSTPAFPPHRSIRPFTVYALEQVRQHYRSERFTEVTDYSHVTVSRSCGGGHTVTSANQRRSGLQSTRLHSQPEGEGGTQSEEVDIVGLDGHIYRGRLNGPTIRHTETKLPTISSRDALKTKDKTKSSSSHKPAASPELHNSPGPHSVRSAQCSRSASSSSTRDWPLSTLGCSSQSSVAQTSAAAPRTSEPADNHQGDL
ncbi:cytospin-A-like isoform X2 [Paralichthys olivaceus]|uniref:cytospin-A-like isoform X2 n=1 Tax=Paralichthys olivaceus TaxID=8255 RepID=UPI003751BC9E